MKGVDGMIRLQKWQLDEKRRELVDMENMRDDLIRRKDAVEDEILSEQRFAAGSEAGFAYAGFAGAAIERRRKFGSSIREIEITIEAKKREVAEIFQELKKFQILAERRAEREKVAEAKRVQADLDEISLNMFRRASNN